MKRITAYRILGEMEDSKGMLYQLVDQVAYCECENYDRGKVLDFVSYLIANGVVVQKQCPVCCSLNDIGNNYCPVCGEPLGKEYK